MRVVALVLSVLAFLVFLKGGARGLIREAVGFGLGVVEYQKGSGSVSVVEFFGKDGEVLARVPVSLFEGAVYLPDDRLI